MFTIILYCAAVSGLGVSLFKSRDKTRLVLKKAWKSFENILPQFLTVLLIIGILLSVFNKDMISKLRCGIRCIRMAMAAVMVHHTDARFVAFRSCVAAESREGLRQITILLQRDDGRRGDAAVESKYFGRKRQYSETVSSSKPSYSFVYWGLLK